MKIACIATSQVPSSTANSIQLMKACQALAQNGHSVTLLLPDVPQTRPADPAERGWEYLAPRYGLEQRFDIEWIPTDLRWKRYDLAWKALARARSLRAGLVYTWLPQAGVLALALGMPTLLEMHDRPTGNLGPLIFQLFLRWPGVKRVLPITQALQRCLERDYHFVFRPGQAVVSPNGADLERYAGLPDAPAARRELELPEQPTAIYTGHFYAGRGMDVLIGLAMRFPQVHFLWVGGQAEDVNHWKQRLEKARLQNVTLTGFIENQRLPLYQAAGDILLMPYEQAIAGSSGGNSADICSPMKMFEYMAAGRAILSSDLPVIREVLNEQNAVFCPPGDPQAWQDTFAALLGAPARQQMLGLQARLDAPRYTWRAREERALKGMVKMG
ncbi:MAG TPA: glycosyltransferase [Anaerolineaceae bacterium]|jgi:glycosyltransferase involved in cell wall biosynthesis